jgi:hypothetical protein
MRVATERAGRGVCRDGAAARVNCSLNGAASSGVAAELRRQRAGPSRAAGVCRRGVGWTCVHRGGRANVVALGRLSRLKGPTVLWIWVSAIGGEWRRTHLGRRARWRLHILLRLSWGRSLSSAVPSSPSAAHPALVFGWGGLRVRAHQRLVVTWRVRVGGWQRCACSAVPATIAAGCEMDIGGEGDGVAVGTVVAGNKEATTRM